MAATTGKKHRARVTDAPRVGIDDRRRVFMGFVASFAVTFASNASAAEKELERTGGPYVPTPKIVVDEMLRMGKVGAKDFVVDLGSGDGIIVLTAAREHKARGMGVDIDPELVSQSNAEAKRLGIADRASFQVQDVFKTDLSKASVITLYLLPSMMMNLRSKIYLEPKPGTRVVSHDYNFDEWHPDEQIVLDVPEKEKVNGVPKATISLWIVPAKVAGRWQVQLEGGDAYDLTLKQAYQVLDGSASTQGKAVKITSARVRGEEIAFTLSDGSVRRHFRGAVSADAMQGTVDLGGGRNSRWTARRA
jgi:hypothetical protein